ncbi:Methionine synthase activation domain [hydrothermal vent metagenome]|uniref:Methionine synthase activation domain n=1 Tax=hydrothermal vent metagenome TaxID=652676 RepID=A0A3B0TMQ1_9ZZZZ
MIREFQFHFEDLGIKAEDLEELIGYEAGNSPLPFPGLYAEALGEAVKLCQIKGGYRILDTVEVSPEGKKIIIEGQAFSPGKIIFGQLQKATSAALYICTAGENISIHAKRLMDKGDLLQGYIFDIIGSVAVEKAIDKMQEALKKEMQISGLNISVRFSPGYCDWNVSEQHQLFSFFPEDFCGVTLGKTSLMYPLKSVSGIIGIGKGLKNKGYQCGWCSDKDCIYGRARRKKKEGSAR